MPSKIIYLAILIIALALFLRSSFLITNNTLSTSPSKMLATQAMQDSIKAGYTEAQNPLSGWPIHNKWQEKWGLIYIATLPYALFNGLIPINTITFLLNGLFIVLGLLPYKRLTDKS